MIRRHLLLLMLLATSCGRVSPDDARDLVERYNRLVSEAYRRGDASVADAVVGPGEGRKLTGLIGVRNDIGVTLDAHLLSLEVTGVTRDGKGLSVTTHETWRYCDRRIGTGEVLGKPVGDSYDMLYQFSRSGSTWLVDEIRFTSPPRVGRNTGFWSSPVRQSGEVTP